MKKETLISVGILFVLAAIGAGVFIKQFHFNPSVLTEGQLAPEVTGPFDPGSAHALSRNDKKQLPVPEGMAPMTVPEIFDPETLYEKIDGKAELYLSAGFKRLLCRRLKVMKPSDSGLWIEAYVYQMDSSANAFAVFSRQRRSDGTALGLTEFSYKTKNAVFFTHGEYYVEIVGSASEEKLFDFMYDFAGQFINTISVKREQKKEFELFPKEGRVPNSISLIPSNAFGYEKLDNIYIATYRKGERQATLFLSNRNTAENAKELLTGYKSFLEMFGGEIHPPDIDVENAALVEIFGTYELFFTTGRYFCGVHESDDIATAKEMAMNLFDSIRIKTDEKTRPEE